MNIQKTLLCILFVVFSCFANIQFDIQNLIIASEEEPAGSQPRSERLWNFDTDIYAVQEDASAGVYFRHRVDGSTMHMALPERVVPLYHHTAFGMEHHGKALVHVGMANDILGRANPIRPYYFSTVDSTLTQKFMNSANARIEVDAKKIGFLLDVTYFNLFYNLGYDEFRATLSEDNDIWTQLYFAFKPVTSFNIGFGTLVKTDMNTSSNFDYGDHFIGLAGDHTIKPGGGRRLLIDWQAEAHYRISAAVHHKGDAEGLAAVLYFNPVFKLKNSLYLKGIGKFDLSQKSQKQWYEFGIKKSWKNSSSIDVSYWNSAGVCFPRWGSHIKTTLYLGKIGFIPDLQLYWRTNRDTQKSTYYRTTASLETLVNSNRVDLYAGYTYSYFKDLKDFEPFASRGIVYCGIRKW